MERLRRARVFNVNARSFNYTKCKKRFRLSRKKVFSCNAGGRPRQKTRKNNEWEEMKARVFSNNGTKDPNDVLGSSGTECRKGRIWHWNGARL
jgi:hypothetical protein